MNLLHECISKPRVEKYTDYTLTAWFMCFGLGSPWSTDCMPPPIKLGTNTMISREISDQNTTKFANQPKSSRIKLFRFLHWISHDQPSLGEKNAKVMQSPVVDQPQPWPKMSPTSWATCFAPWQQHNWFTPITRNRLRSTIAFKVRFQKVGSTSTSHPTRTSQVFTYVYEGLWRWYIHSLTQM